MPLAGAPGFKKYLYEEMEYIYGGMWDCEPDPIKHAQKMIAHSDKKRKELGIDKARDRVLMDMADLQELSLESCVLRKDMNLPVNGYICVFGKSAASE